MSAKHTPGPWEYIDGNVWQKDISDDGDMDIAEIANHVDPENGPLIAAAPEMKDELINLINTFRELKDAGKITEGEFVNITQPTQALIAKAEGRS